VGRGPLTAASALWSALHAGLPPDAIETIRTASSGRFGIRCTGALAGQTAMVSVAREPGTYLASRLWHALSAGGLPTLLRYEDRNSMAFGIEARVPFLDVRLIELAVRLPDRLRIDRGVTKAVLRRAIGERLPREVVDRRDKLGFAAPQRAWLTAGLDEVADLVRNGQIMQRGWVTPTEIERVLAEGSASGRKTEHLWRLFITEAWLRMLWPDAAGVGGRAGWDAALEAAG
jgi:asparagine synthetase B (glutamine-hydrolysing)